MQKLNTILGIKILFISLIIKKNYYFHGLVRKLSVTVSLEDGGAYDGGDLEFDFRNKSDSSPNVMTSKAARKRNLLLSEWIFCLAQSFSSYQGNKIFISNMEFRKTIFFV